MVLVCAASCCPAMLLVLCSCSSFAAVIVAAMLCAALDEAGADRVSEQRDISLEFCCVWLEPLVPSPFVAGITVPKRDLLLAVHCPTPTPHPFFSPQVAHPPRVAHQPCAGCAWLDDGLHLLPHRPAPGWRGAGGGAAVWCTLDLTCYSIFRQPRYCDSSMYTIVFQYRISDITIAGHCTNLVRSCAPCAAAREARLSAKRWLSCALAQPSYNSCTAAPCAQVSCVPLSAMTKLLVTSHTCHAPPAQVTLTYGAGDTEARVWRSHIREIMSTFASGAERVRKQRLTALAAKEAGAKGREEKDEEEEGEEGAGMTGDKKSRKMEDNSGEGEGRKEVGDGKGGKPAGVREQGLPAIPKAGTTQGRFALAAAPT